MNPWQHYLNVWRKYVVFDGRASRSEYWYFQLFNLLIGFAIGFVGVLLLGDKATSTLSLLYSLAVLLPGLAVTVRRLHDTGRSGWWILISLIPFVGGIILLIFMILESDAGMNAYGPQPLPIAAPPAP